MSTKAIRDFVIEVVSNTSIFFQWSRVDPEFEDNVEIYMVWNDNDTYRD